MITATIPTAGQLASMRADNQSSTLYLTIDKPATVFQAEVASTPDSYDVVDSIEYDTVTTGAYTDIVPGMTMLIGTTAGGYDVGIVRVRAAASDTLIPIGVTSDIQWTAAQHLTVLNDFGIWNKFPVTSGGVIYEDFDTAYDASLYPLPVMGSDTVLWLSSTTISYLPDASDSTLLDGTITAYAWTATGASATADMDTATPTITYNTGGEYLISCTVTGSNAKTQTGYRKVFVYSRTYLPITQFVPSNISADGSGWGFDVTLYDNASVSDVRDRAFCVLHSVDGMGGAQSGHENIIAAGWIVGESISWSAGYSVVSFRVEGAAGWLSRIEGAAMNLEDTASPTTWAQVATLTIDKYILHLLTWRSTAAQVIDCQLTGDTTRCKALSLEQNTLWEQFNLADRKILAPAKCDRYSRLFVEIDPQFLSDRSGVPTVMTFQKVDWTESIDISRRRIPTMSQLQTSAYWYDGTTEGQFYSTAAGNVSKLFGSVGKRDDMQTGTQAALNTLTGLLLGSENNDFPELGLTQPGINRFVDIAPKQFVEINLAASDTVRGVSLVGRKFIARQIDYEWNADTGGVLVSYSFEAACTAELAVTALPPQIDVPNIPPIPPYTEQPPWETWEPDPVTNPPVITPPLPPADPNGICPLGTKEGQKYELWRNTTLGNGSGYQKKLEINYASYIRAGTVTYPTYIQIEGRIDNFTSGAYVVQPAAWDNLRVAAVGDDDFTYLATLKTQTPAQAIYEFQQPAGHNIKSYFIESKVSEGVMFRTDSRANTSFDKDLPNPSASFVLDDIGGGSIDCTDGAGNQLPNRYGLAVWQIDKTLDPVTDRDMDVYIQVLSGTVSTVKPPSTYEEGSFIMEHLIENPLRYNPSFTPIVFQSNNIYGPFQAGAIVHLPTRAPTYKKTWQSPNYLAIAHKSLYDFSYVILSIDWKSIEGSTPVFGTLRARLDHVIISNVCPRVV